MGYVTENRKSEGLFLDFSVNRNVAVTIWRRIQQLLGAVRHDKESDVSNGYVETLGIRFSSVKQLAGNLSGGNQQKVSLVKWLAAKTEIIIIDEPTVGIDVRTKATLHDLIMDLADEGMSVADRIMVMRDFQFVGEFDNSKEYPEMSTKAMGAIQKGKKEAVV